jgi:hypothetical protein
MDDGAIVPSSLARFHTHRRMIELALSLTSWLNCKESNPLVDAGARGEW